MPKNLILLSASLKTYFAQVSQYDWECILQSGLGGNSI